MFVQKNPYDTSTIQLNNVNELIKERNFNQFNQFNNNYGTYYGLEYSLKEYLGISNDYEIKAFFDHGITFTKALEAGFRIHECLPTITSSPFRKNLILSQEKNHGAYSIGPYIAYAKSLLNKDELKHDKEKIGKNLLVFPAHSTVETEFNFQHDLLIENIEKFSKECDSVRVCLYWKDVEKGLDKYYRKEGYEIVTAGYMTDPLFLKRLRSLIENADITISNNIGSHTGYCVYLKKPHFFIPMKNKLQNDKSRTGNIKNKVNAYLEECYKKNTNYEDIISLEQQLTYPQDSNIELDSLIEYYFGMSQVKNKKELTNIVDKLENKFSKSKFYLTLFNLLKYYIKTYYKALR